MDKKEKNLINGAIEIAYQYAIENNYSEIEKTEKYKELQDKLDKIESKLYEALPKEQHDLLNELEDLRSSLYCLDARGAFREGIVAGFTQLEFLKEYGGGILYL